MTSCDSDWTHGSSDGSLTVNIDNSDKSDSRNSNYSKESKDLWWQVSWSHCLEFWSQRSKPMISMILFWRKFLILVYILSSLFDSNSMQNMLKILKFCSKYWLKENNLIFKTILNLFWIKVLVIHWMWNFLLQI
jgi:hypothetical protein